MEIVDLFFRTMPLLLMGTLMTLKVLICSAAISFCFGLFFGIFTCHEMEKPFISKAIHYFTFVLRAIPFYVQLLIVYFVFPDLLGINLEVFPASIIALGACSAGYVCQIVRAGLDSIPLAQWEAAFVLGYNKRQTLLYLILPQMLRNVLPAFNNELESMLKSTAILSSIGMLELTRMGMNIISRELKDPLSVYVMVAAVYVVMSVGINIFARKMEKQMRAKVRA